MTTLTKQPSRLGKRIIETPAFEEAGEFGRVAHELLHLKMRKINGDFRSFEGKREAEREHAKISDYIDEHPEIEDITNDATNKVIELLKEYRRTHDNVQLFSERYLHAAPILPIRGGKGDVIIVTDEIIHVLDLKTGKIEEQPNSDQLIVYGVGAFNQYATEHTHTIKLSIIQHYEMRTVAYDADGFMSEAKEIGDNMWMNQLRSTRNELAREGKAFEYKTLRMLEEEPELLDDEIFDVLGDVSSLKSKSYKVGKEIGYDSKKYGTTEGVTRRTVVDMVGAIEWLSNQGFTRNEINETRLGVAKLEKLLTYEQFEQFSILYIEETQSAPSFKSK